MFRNGCEWNEAKGKTEKRVGRGSEMRYQHTTETESTMEMALDSPSLLDGRHYDDKMARSPNELYKKKTNEELTIKNWGTLN